MHRLSNSRMLQNHAGALLKGSFKSPTSGSSSWRQVPGDVLLNKRHVAQGQIYSCLGTLFPTVVAECVGEVVFTRFLCIRGYKCPSLRSLSTNTNKVPSINKAFSCLKVLEVAGQLSLLHLFSQGGKEIAKKRTSHSLLVSFPCLRPPNFPFPI